MAAFSPSNHISNLTPRDIFSTGSLQENPVVFGDTYLVTNETVKDKLAELAASIQQSTGKQLSDNSVLLDITTKNILFEFSKLLEEKTAELQIGKVSVTELLGANVSLLEDIRRHNIKSFFDIQKYTSAYYGHSADILLENINKNYITLVDRITIGYDSIISNLSDKLFLPFTTTISSSFKAIEGLQTNLLSQSAKHERTTDVISDKIVKLKKRSKKLSDDPDIRRAQLLFIQRQETRNIFKRAGLQYKAEALILKHSILKPFKKIASLFSPVSKSVGESAKAALFNDPDFLRSPEFLAIGPKIGFNSNQVLTDSYYLLNYRAALTNTLNHIDTGDDYITRSYDTLDAYIKKINSALEKSEYIARHSIAIEPAIDTDSTENLSKDAGTGIADTLFLGLLAMVGVGLLGLISSQFSDIFSRTKKIHKNTLGADPTASNLEFTGLPPIPGVEQPVDNSPEIDGAETISEGAAVEDALEDLSNVIDEVTASIESVDKDLAVNDEAIAKLDAATLDLNNSLTNDSIDSALDAAAEIGAMEEIEKSRSVAAQEALTHPVNISELSDTDNKVELAPQQRFSQQEHENLDNTRESEDAGEENVVKDLLSSIFKNEDAIGDTEESVSDQIEEQKAQVEKSEAEIEREFTQNNRLIRTLNKLKSTVAFLQKQHIMTDDRNNSFNEYFDIDNKNSIASRVILAVNNLNSIIKEDIEPLIIAGGGTLNLSASAKPSWRTRTFHTGFLEKLIRKTNTSISRIDKQHILFKDLTEKLLKFSDVFSEATRTGSYAEDSLKQFEGWMAAQDKETINISVDDYENLIETVDFLQTNLINPINTVINTALTPDDKVKRLKEILNNINPRGPTPEPSESLIHRQ